MRFRILAPFAAASALLFSSCTAPMNNAQRDAAIGGGLGAATGAIIGNNVGDGNAARGALIGGALGAGAGYLHGKNKDNQQYYQNY